MATFWNFLMGTLGVFVAIVIIVVGLVIVWVLFGVSYAIIQMVKCLPKVKVFEGENLQKSVLALDKKFLSLLKNMKDNGALEFKNKKRDDRIEFVGYELFDKGFSRLKQSAVGLRGFRDDSNKKRLYFTIIETPADNVMMNDFIEHRKGSRAYRRLGEDAYNYLSAKKWWLLELSPEGDKFRITRTALPSY